MRNLVFLINIIVLLLSFSLQSVATEVYNVKAIKVSTTNQSASIAKNLAIEKGQIQAFQVLVKQHYPNAFEASMNLDKQKIIDTVVSFDLYDERRSTTNYFTKLNVRFNRDKIDKLMKELGASFNPGKIKNTADDITLPSTNAPTMNTLLIPVLQQSQRVYWPDEENNWSQFWDKKLQTIHNSKFILPLSDLEDMELLNKDILKANISELKGLMDRYNVNNVAILKLSEEKKQPTSSFPMQVNYISKYHPAWQQHNFNDITGNNFNEVMEESYKLINSFQFSAGQNYFAENKINVTSPNKIIINYSIEKLSDWLDLENMLRQSRYISNMNLTKVSIYEYDFSFTYNISFSDLQMLLNTYNFDLKDNGEGKFLLMRNVPNAQL
jgi:hypothetical protein